MSSLQTEDGLWKLTGEVSVFLWRSGSALFRPDLVLSFKEKCDVNLGRLELSVKSLEVFEECTRAVDVSFVVMSGWQGPALRTDLSSKQLTGISSCFHFRQSDPYSLPSLLVSM